jgi:hypothetical protein
MSNSQNNESEGSKSNNTATHTTTTTKAISVAWTERHRPPAGHYGGVHPLSMQQNKDEKQRRTDKDEEVEVAGCSQSKNSAKLFVGGHSIIKMQEYERSAYEAANYLREICPTQLERLHRVVLR